MRAFIIRIRQASPLAARFAILVVLFGASGLRAQEFVHSWISAPWVNGADSVAWADFDQNGSSDLIVAYHTAPLTVSGSDRVGVVMNPMTNTLAASAGPLVVLDTTTFPPPYGVVRHIVTGDFDGDGDDDILIEAVPLNATGQLTNGIIYRVSSLGGGGFSAPVAVYNGVVCSDFKTGDFNGDGIRDSVEVGTTNGTQSFERVFLGAAGAPWPVYQTSSYFVTAPIMVADMNLDGTDDLGYQLSTQSTAMTAHLSGAGSPLASMIQPNAGTHFTNTAEFHVADVTDDGVPDVINHLGAAATIFPGSTTSFLQPSLPQGVSGMGTAFAPTDVDLDGSIDFLSVSSTASYGVFEARMAANQGGGVFSTPLALSQITALGASFIGLERSDVDGDGDDDYIVLRRHGFASGIDIFENRATYGVGCSGLFGVPAIAVGSAHLGNPSFGIGISGATPGTTAVLVLSTTATPQASCGLLVDTSPNALLLPGGQVIAGPTSAVGDGLWSTPIPNFPALANVAIAAQWAVLDTFGYFTLGQIQLALSQGRIIRFR